MFDLLKPFVKGGRRMVRTLVAGVGVFSGWVWGAEALMLPDGSWIGPPMVVGAKPALPTAVSPFEWYRPIERRFSATIGEDKTLLRKLYEVLPAALQKTVKSPPLAPRKTTVYVPLDQVLVFPTGGGWPMKGSRYAYAFADQNGNIGEGMPDAMERHVGELAYLPAVLPRLSPEVSLMAWELAKGEYQADFSKPPVAKMVFANPVYSTNPSAPLWPDGKTEVERIWRGRTLRLEKATRVQSDFEDQEGKKRSAGVAFDFVVQGARSAADLGELQWFLEDNRGNYYMPSSRGSSSGSDSRGVLVSHGSSAVAFWPENLNWRLTLVLRPSNLGVMTENEYRRIRIKHPKGKIEDQVVETSFELNGAVFKNLRIRQDPNPQNHDLPKGAPWYLPAVIELDVEKVPPDVLIEVSHFYDGFVPFEDRPGGIRKPALRGRGQSGAQIRVALDKQADYLEFVLSVTREEQLEFYFQPELKP